MMIWKKNKETLNLNDPVKTLLPKKNTNNKFRI